MVISLKKIHHLIRYFVSLGLIIFLGYLKHWQDDLFLILIGPVLYLASVLKGLITSFISIPSSDTINYFGLLLPLCMLYFGLLGFQLKQLWNERGKVKFLSLFALLIFVIYIHHTAWKNLSAYFLPPRAPSLRTLSFNQHPVADRPVGDNQAQTVSV